MKIMTFCTYYIYHMYVSSLHLKIIADRNLEPYLRDVWNFLEDLDAGRFHLSRSLATSL